jgi:type IV pilus biogenesis/stability protein PilW
MAEKNMNRFVFCLCLLLLQAGCATHQRSPEVLSDKASTQYQFAYESFVRGDLIPALAAALHATEMAPNNPDAKNLLGLIYFRQQKYELAEAVFKDAVALDPKLSEGWNNLGTMYFEQNRLAEAKTMLEKALENPLYLYPERIYNNLGLVHEKLGEKPQAIAAYERAIEVQHEFYLPFQNLGKLYYETGNLKRARSLLKEATQICRDCSQPRYYLGLILLKDNKTTEALKVFKEGAATDPRGYYGQLCQQYIVKE